MNVEELIIETPVLTIDAQMNQLGKNGPREFLSP